MKRTIAVVAGIITLGVAAYIGSRLWAQQGYTQQGGAAAGSRVAPLQTRVAVVNLNEVIRNYNKWKNFQDWYRTESERVYKSKIEPIERDLKNIESQLQGAAGATLEPSKREALEKRGRALSRERQDLIDEANQSLTKQKVDMQTTCYQEVVDAVADLAQRQGFELILHYNDGMTDQERKSPQILLEKMKQVSLVPMYHHPHMDITKPVYEALNKRVPLTPPTQPAGAATGGSRPPQ